MRLAGSGEGDRGDADGMTADDRRERRSRPSRPNRTRTPTDPETNRQKALNTRVSTAPDAVSALREFAEAHRAFPNGVNDVNVAALFVVLARSNRLCSSRGTSAAHLEGLEGGDDETFESSDEESSVAFARTVVADLLVRLSELAPNTTGRVCANVLHALGQLEAREWWTRVKRKPNGGGVRREGEDVGFRFAEVFEDAATSVARRAARTASAMNAQELANAYNGISRLDAFAAASVSHAGWVALSEALVTRATQKRTSDFAALAAVLALNALASDKLAAAASATSQSAFDALISVAARAKQWDDSEARAVEKLSEQGLANVLNACAKLEKARLAVERLETAAPRDEDEDEDELSRFRDEGDDETKTKTKRNGWRLFTSRVASLAPRFGDQGLSVALHALTLCGDDARASVDDRGWRAFAEATERLAPTASPQAAAMLLNAAWKLRAEPSARGFYFAPSALDALGRRTAEILLEDDANRTLNARKKKRTFLLDEQATFVAADALGKLPAARAGFAAVAALSAKKRRATRKDAWFLLAERLANRVIEDDVYEKQKQERVVSGGGGPAASFHVLARVPELAQALTTKRVWRDVGASLCLLAPSLDAEDCARVLNGYAKQRRNALVLESTPKMTLKALARRVAMLAASEDVEAAHVATLADALKKLSVARGEFDALAARNLKRPFMEPARNPWDDLAVVIASSADLLEPLQVTNVVSALGWLEPLASALARVEGGWRSVLAAAERRADSIKRGANESIAASAPDFSEAPEAKKWLEKTSAGFELVRGHTEYLTYGDERDRERLVALETEFRNELARIAGD